MKSASVHCEMEDKNDLNRTRFREKNLSAFVVGHTGETGKLLVRELLESKVFSRVVLIGRRQVSFGDEALFKDVEQEVVDFDKLEESSEVFQNIHAGFCCLGTTRKKSGADGFYKVDHDYVMNVARCSLASGCKDFHVVSSQGADKNSCLLYTRTKGEVEAELQELGFERLTIYQPAMLMGDREESRLMESCFRACLRPVMYCCPTLMTTPMNILATSMVNRAVEPPTQNQPWHIVNNTEIHQLAR